ncbi:hypothetical protein JVU11DRAFT_5015 [Chiua virens]|nr:hypothetical protein JVU11DRAFT_5015 [Chiua virens]
MAHRFLRRSSTFACFFCLSTPSSPLDPRSFRCPHCGCWNRYDANGEIMSDEPAMHDEKMNASSFAKRGLSPLAVFHSSPTHAPHSIPQQGPSSIHIRQRSFLPHLSDQPNASRQPPFKLSATPTGEFLL